MASEVRNFDSEKQKKKSTLQRHVEHVWGKDRDHHIQFSLYTQSVTCSGSQLMMTSYLPGLG